MYNLFLPFIRACNPLIIDPRNHSRATLKAVSTPVLSSVEMPVLSFVEMPVLSCVEVTVSATTRTPIFPTRSPSTYASGKPTKGWTTKGGGWAWMKARALRVGGGYTLVKQAACSSPNRSAARC